MAETNNDVVEHIKKIMGKQTDSEGNGENGQRRLFSVHSSLPSVRLLCHLLSLWSDVVSCDLIAALR